jgi:hypothetical protein
MNTSIEVMEWSRYVKLYLEIPIIHVELTLQR